ncbi:MAG: GlsB/YeaQ/YmgE family stress response membrane protein [Anaerolineaceae bacterium]
MWNIFGILVIGLIAGFIADKIVKNTFGLWGDLLIGVAGSFLGYWIFGLLGISVGSFFGEIIAAVVGAVILLLVINLFKKK